MRTLICSAISLFLATVVAAAQAKVANDMQLPGVTAIASTTADPNGYTFFIDTYDQHGKRNIVAPGAAPAWSPDGRKIAFCTDDKGLASRALLRRSLHGYGINVNMLQGLIPRPEDFSSLAIVDADGTGLKKLAEQRGWDGVCEPSWSPDGHQIAYARWQHKKSLIYITAETGTDSRFITEGYRPQWSPDGRRLTFFRAPHKPGSKSSIWVVNADGSGLRRITDEGSRSWTPTWTGDGKIMFASDQEGTSAIYEIEADGTNARQIAAPKDFDLQGGLYTPRPSPDGKWLVVDNYPFPGGWPGSQTVILDLDGRHHYRLLVAGIDVAVRWQKTP